MREYNRRTREKNYYLLYVVYGVWLPGVGLLCFNRPEAMLFFCLAIFFKFFFLVRNPSCRTQQGGCGAEGAAV